MGALVIFAVVAVLVLFFIGWKYRAQGGGPRQG